jgi:hypothetical protein
MGWRFRKRFRILPGVWQNASKRSGSISLGGHGATLSLGPRGMCGTASIPHTGISYVTPYVRPNLRKGASLRHPPRGKPSLLGAIGHFLFG